MAPLRAGWSHRRHRYRGNKSPTGRRRGGYDYAYVYEYAAGENSSRPRLERPAQGPARNGADVLARSDGRRRSTR